MLQNAYLRAKIGADTAENERDFAEILPKIGVTLGVRQAIQGARAIPRLSSSGSGMLGGGRRIGGPAECSVGLLIVVVVVGGGRTGGGGKPPEPKIFLSLILTRLERKS